MRPLRRATWRAVTVGIGMASLASISASTSAADAPADLGLDDIGRLYLAGQTDQAVAALSAWDRDKADAETSRLLSAGGQAEERERSLRAAAIVLAERGVLDARVNDLRRVRWELRNAQTLVAGLGEGSSTRFTQRTYLLFVLVFHAVADLGAAYAAVVDGLEAFPTDAELLVAKGTIAETVVTLREYEDPAEMPMWRPPPTGPGAPTPSPSLRRRDPLANCYSIEGIPDSRACLPPQSLRQAESQYSSALGQDPELVEARLRLARVRLLRNDPREALSHLEKISPGTASPAQLYLARLFEGQAREAIDDLVGAAAAYEAATEIDPEGQSALIALGRARNFIGERSRAQEAFSRALRPTRSADPWWVYLHGQPDRVMPVLEELRGLVP